MKPGVTGRVQLEAGDEAESIPEGVYPEEYYLEHMVAGKLRRDLDYLSVRTPLSDVRIVFETATFVFRALVGR